MPELPRHSDADPRRSAAFLLEAVRDGAWRTRAELRAVVGAGWPLLLRALEHDGHRFARERSKRNPAEPGDWFRIRLAYDAEAVAEAVVPAQLALAVSGSAPPRSALLGLEDAA